MHNSPPGVMLYYDLLPCLSAFSDQDLGKLFRAILQYRTPGDSPDFSDHIGLTVAWSFIRPRIERDVQQYNEKVRKARYAAYAREAKAKNHTVLDYTEWCVEDTLRSLPIATDSAR